MRYKQNIKIWVIGTVFLWLLSALMPAVSIYVFQEADQISMTGTLEEEEKKEGIFFFKEDPFIRFIIILEKLKIFSKF